MRRVVFSRAARDDRREITEYTVEHFGVQQAHRLRENFEVALRDLATFPGSGRTNPQLDPPGHSFRYAVVMKRFIVVYESTNASIRVARILTALGTSPPNSTATSRTREQVLTALTVVVGMT